MNIIKEKIPFLYFLFSPEAFRALDISNNPIRKCKTCRVLDKVKFFNYAFLPPSFAAFEDKVTDMIPVLPTWVIYVGVDGRRCDIEVNEETFSSLLKNEKVKVQYCIGHLTGDIYVERINCV